jgi:hypothetical protein
VNRTPTDCYDEDALGVILESPADDPRRRHVESCPRCGARALSYQRFLEAEAGESLRSEDHARLATLRAELTGGPGVSRANTSAMRERARPGWREWFKPAWQSALAFAAVVIVAGVFLSRPEGERAVRGPDDARGTATAVAARNGDVRFAWPTVPEADRYEVRIHSTGLGLLARFDAGPDSALTVPASDMPPEYRDGQVVLFRVVALAGSDELAAGTARPLQMPGAAPAR